MYLTSLAFILPTFLNKPRPPMTFFIPAFKPSRQVIHILTFSRLSLFVSPPHCPFHPILPIIPARLPIYLSIYLSIYFFVLFLFFSFFYCHFLIEMSLFTRSSHTLGVFIPLSSRQHFLGLYINIYMKTTNAKYILYNCMYIHTYIYVNIYMMGR